jgi:hypothetical protein
VESTLCETVLTGVQDEYISFRATSERVAEAKDGEMARVLGSNAALRDQLASLQVKLVHSQLTSMMIIFC